MQIDGGVSRSLREQRVGNVIGLAKPKRQRQHDLLADPLDDRVRNTAGGLEALWNCR